jgi:hypothetical protein
MESKDALKDEHVRRVDRCSIIQARVFLEGVYRDLSLFTGEESARFKQMMMKEHIPFFDVSKFFNQDIKVDSIRRVEIVLVPVCSFDLIRSEGSIERILEGVGITKATLKAQTNEPLTG